MPISPRLKFKTTQLTDNELIEKYNQAIKLHSIGKKVVEISDILMIQYQIIDNWVEHGDVPHVLWGPEKYFIFKEKTRIAKIGKNNPNWRGDKASQKAGQVRAERNIPCPKGFERHHIDGNELNNNPSNILIVTRKQHMIIDGRMGKFIKYDRHKKAHTHV